MSGILRWNGDPADLWRIAEDGEFEASRCYTLPSPDRAFSAGAVLLQALEEEQSMP